MRMSERDRRDWSLLIFIVPLGILLMLIAGQFAMRIIPQWILNVGMGSRLEVETAGGQQNFIQPLFNIQILTPFSWQNTYLTPNADGGFAFPPFVVLEPSATPSPAEAPSSTETATPPPATVSPSATTVTPSATVVVTATTPPPQDTSTPPTETAVPTTETPTAVPTTETPTAIPTGITSTPDLSYTLDPPPTPALGIGDPPDDDIADIPENTYVVINLSVEVGLTPDNNYDLVFYEYDNGGQIALDWIIIGISIYSDGHEYYEVFNWGNGTPDTNSNVGDVAGAETDNQSVPLTELHDSDDAGPAPQTGILIDVDNAPSNPPVDTYDYIVIISPAGGGDPAQVDSVQPTEVPIPTP